MLIEFSVANFLSIKDRQTLRMDAASISDYPERVINAGRHKLLRSAAIYGANASGKSNLLKAMNTMRVIIIDSVAQSSTAEIITQPFLLSTQTENSPSYFEILFLINGIEYRYGFEADRKIVRSEWLFETKKQKEKPLFLRENEVIDVFRDFKEGKGLEERTRANTLFLSVCDQFNGPIAELIMKWFYQFNSISGNKHEGYKKVTFDVLDNKNLADEINNFFSEINLGFDKLKLSKEPFTPAMLPANMANFKEAVKEFNGKVIVKTFTSHAKYDDQNQVIEQVDFMMEDQESSGTNKLFDLSGPVFYELRRGGILTVDELDSKLHPLLTQAIIRLFNNPATNPKNAQLIFATHDTNLLTYGQFRRDQIWFTEKDQYGATHLYSLVEYKEEDGVKVRKDRSFESDYIQGRYGAIPYIGDFSKLMQHGAES